MTDPTDPGGWQQPPPNYPPPPLPPPPVPAGPDAFQRQVLARLDRMARLLLIMTWVAVFAAGYFAFCLLAWIFY